MKTIKETEYVYASTRVKAADGKGTSKERIASFAEAADRDALTAAIIDSGLVPDEARGAVDSPADAADAALRGAADLLVSSVPDPDVYDFLFYKYDCCNIKTALKESITSEHDPSRYFTCGTVPADVVISSVSSRDYSLLPPSMGKRAEEARNTYETTAEARCIDLLLDVGCFEDASRSAEESGVPFFREYVSLLADAANYSAFLRISSSGASPEAVSTLVKRAVVPGGSAPAEVFGSAAEAETHAERIDALLMKTDRVAYRDIITSSDDPEAVSEAFDRLISELVRTLDFKAFGPEIPAAFFIKREAEVRAVRIAASMIGAGKSADEIKKRVGLEY